ncbi:methylcobamide--CoM methyltransferase [Clostridium sp. YIM B02515]|uniref:Methylcobamide--CoM methyltransferase n=1 Tax=Clostridium rhizosphaerae TaxID=2803861 RepID=A0ABS1T4Y7_9CLOT|nr:uroporphyrinogen decarboxylase family protein [Clostridium rhizosphaerae]MBL4934397.1 methylcobamide--CoM methyltransferase [Clostridium rhizosphaerae]
MENQINFKCTLDKFEEIPESVANQTGITFPEAHTKVDKISILAKTLKNHHKDSISRVPFCLTVEAEALGADIKLGDEKIGPRVGEYAYKSIEDLKNIKPIDFSTGRISEVLKAVEKLSSEGEEVALNIQGPFTIMSSLIDPVLFYKAVRKDRAAVEAFMEVICKSTVQYAEEGLKRGAKIISYGDSAGNIDILGPKMYKDFSGRYSYEVLKQIESKLGKAFVHICGVTSTSLNKSGFIKSTPIGIDKDMTYGDALKLITELRKDVKLIGYNCLKRTTLKMKKPVVWKIELI